METENKNLPVLRDIEELAISIEEKEKALSVVLNQNPPPTWIKKQNGVKYIPIDKVRYLLTRYYPRWDQEIKNVQVIGNSVVVTLTLHYYNPFTGELRKNDGIGAAPINTKKSTGAMDWSEIVHDSVHKCAPAAAAFALKNAAKKLGRLFGAELNSEDNVDYTTLISEAMFKDATITEK